MEVWASKGELGEGQGSTSGLVIGGNEGVPGIPRAENAYSMCLPLALAVGNNPIVCRGLWRMARLPQETVGGHETASLP